jgi:hypothetical protein
VREQEVSHLLLIVGHRLDVHERAREFEEIHIRRIFQPLNFWEEAKRKEGTARKKLGLLPLDSASSTNYNNWMTVVRP